ncbi:hypothetical protein [Rugamonas rubra]|uniref:Uncharacterized protein n=1 Tax=Rugamonas rubra TaxID=758825 RepID=A0A1I4UAG8_9BURK|nr:hypothetical protein [Rugamonas rubra]SFM85996.1 hypothetical protein SAMN02982985_05570 [Rugamonas rubra]
MKMRNIKRRIYRNRRFPKKVFFIMRYIEVNTSLYPLNDRVIYRTDVLPNGDHILLLNYTDRSGADIKIGNVTNYQGMPFEKQIEKVLIGRIKEVKL